MRRGRRAACRRRQFGDIDLHAAVQQIEAEAEQDELNRILSAAEREMER